MNSDLETPHRPTDLLTVSETAHLLRVSKMTVYRLIQTGRLTAITAARSFRIPRTEVTPLLPHPRGNLPGTLTEPRPIGVPEQTKIPAATTATTSPRRFPATTGSNENSHLGVYLAGPSTAGRAVPDRRDHPPTSAPETPRRHRESVITQWVQLITTPKLARLTLTRLLNTGAQIQWLSAELPYGEHPGLRSWCQRTGINYIMVIPGEHRIDTAHGQVPAHELTRAAGRNCWQRPPSGTTRTHHPPDDWLLVDPDPHPDLTARGHLLLVRRPPTSPDQLTYYRCHSTQPVTLSELIAVASARHHPQPG